MSLSDENSVQEVCYGMLSYVSIFEIVHKNMKWESRNFVLACIRTVASLRTRMTEKDRVKMDVYSKIIDHEFKNWILVKLYYTNISLTFHNSTASCLDDMCACVR